MWRLGLALMIALLGHALFLLAPFPGESEEVVELMGQPQIMVRIAADGAALENSEAEVAQARPESDQPEQETAQPVERQESEESPVELDSVEAAPEQDFLDIPEVSTAEDALPSRREAEPRQEHVEIRAENKKIKQQQAENVEQVEQLPEQSVKQDVAEQTAIETVDSAAEQIQAENVSTSTAEVNSELQRAASQVIEAAPLEARNSKPVYPALARKRNWQGTVTLLVEVSEEGRALAVSVEKSSGYKILDMSAVSAVKKWRFSPATSEGVPEVGTVLVPVAFVLQ